MTTPFLTCLWNRNKFLEVSEKFHIFRNTDLHLSYLQWYTQPWVTKGWLQSCAFLTAHSPSSRWCTPCPSDVSRSGIGNPTKAIGPKTEMGHKGLHWEFIHRLPQWHFWLYTYLFSDWLFQFFYLLWGEGNCGFGFYFIWDFADEIFQGNEALLPKKKKEGSKK